MGIAYRKATIQDIELLLSARLALIEEDSGTLSDGEKDLLYSGNKEYMTAALQNDTFYAFLAFDGDRFVGTCGICIYSVLPGRKLPNGKNAYIQNMYVAPPYRRQGIAKHLVTMAVGHAKLLGHNRITLHATNQGRLLFENCGFSDSGSNNLTLMVYMK